MMLTAGKFALEKCEFLRAPSLSKKSSSIDKCVYIQCYNLQGFGEGWWKSCFSDRRLVKEILLKKNPRNLLFDN
jgi:hypothetical protein